MDSMLLTAISAGLYLISAGLLAKHLFRARPPLGARKIAFLWPALLAAATHAGLLYKTICCTQTGLNLSFLNALSLVAWLTTSLMLLSTLKRPLENLAIILLPLTALIMLVTEVLHGGPSIEVQGDASLRVHILVSIIAYSILSLAALQAGLVAVQHNSLRKRQPGGFIRVLPPLAAMETLLFQMIGLGFILLTASLLTGFIYLEDMFAQHVVHKTILSITGWLIFAILLTGRLRFGWRGRTAIRWTMLGFVALMLAYFGTKLVLEWLIGR